ncbi:catabolite control protein A [Staphylococcus aureus]|nr:catabolite control protein A [Staphylococcus aureus]
MTVTIYDVAREARVSMATGARLLMGTKMLKQKLKIKLTKSLSV